MMDAAVSEGIEEGERLHSSAEWGAAASAFESMLAIHDEPAARDGLGRALWRIRDVDRAISERTAASAGFHRHGQKARAFRAAVWLARASNKEGTGQWQS